MRDLLIKLKQTWREYSLPLAPRQPIPDRIKQIVGPDQDVLLLGVTPDYYGIGKTLTACEISPDMIAAIWPGNTSDRKAIRSDWRDMPFENAKFDCVLGDGSLSNIPTDSIQTVLRETVRVLRPMGRVVHRSFCVSDTPDSLEAVRDQAFAGEISSLSGLRLKLFHASVAKTSSTQVALPAILENFNSIFPDRDALARAGGWSRNAVDTIDRYKNSPGVYSFLTQAAFSEIALKYFDKLSVRESGDYQFSELCPIFILEGPKGE